MTAELFQYSDQRVFVTAICFINLSGFTNQGFFYYNHCYIGF